MSLRAAIVTSVVCTTAATATAAAAAAAAASVAVCLMMAGRAERDLSLSNDHPPPRPHESLMRLPEVTCRAPGRTHRSATAPRRFIVVPSRRPLSLCSICRAPRRSLIRDRSNQSINLQFLPAQLDLPTAPPTPRPAICGTPRPARCGGKH